jgi:hypothetical protein
VLATDTSLARRSLALGLYAIPLALSGLAWYLVYWGW